jgi:transcriptional regulator with XRE-family HTH domain
MAHQVDVHVGSKVRERRKVKGLTQAQVATELGISFQQMQKYETGSNRISSSKLFEIAKFMDCPITYFFEGLDGVEADGEAPRTQTEVRMLHATRAMPRKLRSKLLEMAEMMVDKAS